MSIIELRATAYKNMMGRLEQLVKMEQSDIYRDTHEEILMIYEWEELIGASVALYTDLSRELANSGFTWDLLK